MYICIYIYTYILAHIYIEISQFWMFFLDFRWTSWTSLASYTGNQQHGPNLQVVELVEVQSGGHAEAASVYGQWDKLMGFMVI